MVRRLGAWSLATAMGAAAAVSGATDRDSAEITGRARVVDGDSLFIGNVEVRLYGLDAPEWNQTCGLDGGRWPCGRHATQALRSRIAGETVQCAERDRDRYGRAVAVCKHDGIDVNDWLVRSGWALAYRRLSDVYVAAESAAESERRGIWRGEFVAPWDWREAERRGELGTSSEASRAAQCDIKGNISHRSGRRLYHMPGDPGYAATRISEDRGERWFCSEAEARRAGWQRTGRLTTP